MPHWSLRCRTIVVLQWLMLLFVSSPTGAGTFAYVANWGSNNVSGFSVDVATGALTPVTGSPFPAGALPYSVAVSPNGAYVYVVNTGSPNVSAYAIHPSTGMLTPVPGSPFPTAPGSTSIAVSPDGLNVYVANASVDTVSAYVIDASNGALTPVPGSPFPSGSDPFSLALSPSGAYAYVANYLSADVTVYSRDAITGALTPVPGSPFPAASGANAVAVSPNGSFVYVANRLADNVTAYRVNAGTGALTPVPGSTFAPGAQPGAVLVAPDGRHAYVPTLATNTISVYDIDAGTGAITPIAGSPFCCVFSSFSTATTLDGKYLYAANFTASGSVSAFSIAAATGALTTIAGSPFPSGSGALSVAVANTPIVKPPSIAKSFGSGSIPLNGTTPLTFTLLNPNASVSLGGVAFTDTLPAGLIVATPNGLVSTCSGMTTATAGTGSVSLSGGGLAGTSSCTISLNVRGMTAGVKNNSVQVNSTEGGAGNTSSASLVVVAPPTIAKAFGTSSVALGSSTSLTLALTNPNATVALSNVAVSDALPAGLVVATPDGLTNSCGGTVTATEGSSSIVLTGGAIAAASNCAISVNVTGIAAGTWNNATGAIGASEGGTGTTSNTAQLFVVAPPVLSKWFDTTTLRYNESATLTFTIVNPAVNTVALTGVAFTDPLTAGAVLAVASPNGVVNTCGGSVTAVSGAYSVSLSGGTVPVNGSCTVSVVVVPIGYGPVDDLVQVTSANGGNGNVAAASLVVLQHVIPVVQSWALLALVLALGGLALVALSRRRE